MEERAKRGRPRGPSGSVPNDAPPPPPSMDPLEKQAEELKSLKLTPQFCRDMGEHFAKMEATFYAVAARVFADERWNLQKEEIQAQADLAAMGLLVYGDKIKAWVVPVVLVVGFTSPLIARAVLLAPKDKSHLGGPGTDENGRPLRTVQNQ